MSPIDILMPYYGDVAMMQAAVRSVLDQTDKDWRMTVVDDGTAPGVPEWFASLGDERVRYIRNAENLGVTGNYQKCLTLVENDLLVFMGCDDLMMPDYLRIVRAAHEAYPDAAVIQPGVEVMGTDGRRSTPLNDVAKKRLFAPRGKGRRLLGGEDLVVSLIRGNWLYFPSLCWRSDVAVKVGFPDGMDEVHDLAMVIDALTLPKGMVVDDTVCFRYRRHAVSHSSTAVATGQRFTTERRYFTELGDRLETLGWERAAQAARNHVGSRLHALTALPSAVRRGQTESVRNLTRHVLGERGARG